MRTIPTTSIAPPPKPARIPTPEYAYCTHVPKNDAVQVNIRTTPIRAPIPPTIVSAMPTSFDTLPLLVLRYSSRTIKGEGAGPRGPAWRGKVPREFSRYLDDR